VDLGFDESVYLRINEFAKGLIQYTDTTNAYRLLEQHGADIRYNALWKKWLVWNGKHWEMDDGYLIHDRGLKMIRNIYDDLRKKTDYRDRLELERHAVQSENARRRKALIEVASWIPELNIKTEDLDKDPWLLNVKNGTVDLKTGDMREHRREDYVTRIANVDFTPQADCPVWKKFIMEIMNYEPELIRFLQTAAGWGITGDTSEQTMFILFGSGANGKSTFLKTSGSVKVEIRRTRRGKTGPDALKKAVEEKPDAYLRELSRMFDCAPSSVYRRLVSPGFNIKKDL
jgi:putative DNA primase/helicase